MPKCPWNMPTGFTELLLWCRGRVPTVYRFSDRLQNDRPPCGKEKEEGRKKQNRVSLLAL